MADLDRLFRVDFYPQDWLIATGKMTPEQRGVFIQIVALIYSHRGAIENDPAWIGRAANCSSRLVRSVIDQLVASDDLQIDGSKIRQRRCERELNAHRTRLEYSAKGGRNKAENERKSKENKDLSSSDANASPPSPSYPIPSQLRDEAKASSAPLPPKGEAELKLDLDPPAKPKEPKNGKRLIPPDWQPDAAAHQLAASLGVDLNACLGEFLDWVKSKRPMYADWQATFRNSLRRASQSGRFRKQGGAGFGREAAGVVNAGVRVSDRYKEKLASGL